MVFCPRILDAAIEADLLYLGITDNIDRGIGVAINRPRNGLGLDPVHLDVYELLF